MGVLVADDEHDMARALEAMLKSDGYEVDTVYDGQAGSTSAKPARTTASCSTS